MSKLSKISGGELNWAKTVFYGVTTGFARGAPWKFKHRLYPHSNSLIALYSACAKFVVFITELGGVMFFCRRNRRNESRVWSPAMCEGHGNLHRGRWHVRLSCADL